MKSHSRTAASLETKDHLNKRKRSTIVDKNKDIPTNRDYSSDSDEDDANDTGKDGSNNHGIDDPNQYHARPRDLSQNALERPNDKSHRNTSTVFTKIDFSSLDLHPRLNQHISKIDGGMGIKTCTKVQSLVLPQLKEKRQNMLIKSQTGSGKTLAFLVPIVNDLISLVPQVNRLDGCRALIVAPTRELCTQIAEVLQKLTQCCIWIVGGCITGGERKKSEKSRLRKGVVVLVSTPGRLLDHLQSTESFNLTQLRWLVLDEVDRLLDMGFEQTILQIMSIIRGTKIVGLKEKNQGSVSTSGGGGKGQAMNLQQKWSKQEQGRTKQCAAPRNLVLLMCSATLTRSVKLLALPLLGRAGTSSGSGIRSSNDVGFMVVNADGKDGEHLSLIQNEADILNLDASTSNFEEDDGEEEGEEGGRGGRVRVTPAGSGALLQKGETVDAPSRLAQYFMMVSCKWRLAALLCFLRTHTEQKVIVFLSTCDAVDYLALLLREMEWPETLDPAPILPTSSEREGEDAPRGSSSSSSSSSSFLSKYASQTLEPLERKFIGLRNQGYDDDDDDGKSNKKNKNDTSASSTDAFIEKYRQQESIKSQQQRSGSKSRQPASTSRIGSSRHGGNTIYRLHGNVPQQARKEVFAEFCAAGRGVLLCTDVAARGLDLPGVDWILQFDPPCETADYVHRIGRTARKGQAGSALLFLLPSEAAYVPLLATHGLQPEPLSLQSLFLDTAKKYIPGAVKFKNTDEMAAVILQRRAERVVHDNKWLLLASRQAFRSFVRSYATHSLETKGIFAVQSLHLGHVAKSFGLRENPKSLRSADDVIAKIYNGAFSAYNTANTAVNEKRQQAKSSSDRKLTGNHKRKRDTSADSEREQDRKNKKTGAISSSKSNSNASSKTENPGVVVKSGRDKQKVRKMGRASSSSSTSAAAGKKLRLQPRKKSSNSGGSNSNAELTASGVFRKTTGYFKKKLRSQMSSEFSST